MNKQPSIWIISSIAIVFGLLTIKEGGMVLFGSESMRGAAGNYVTFVLRFNFIAGFFYIITGIGLWQQMNWAFWLAVTILSATVFTFIAFGVHIFYQGAYELRTVIAMSLRTLVWAAIVAIALRNKR